MKLFFVLEKKLDMKKGAKYSTNKIKHIRIVSKKVIATVE